MIEAKEAHSKDHLAVDEDAFTQQFWKLSSSSFLG